ncbi:MAG: sigma-70 family RNA polymerase sigma factor [Tannerella sp.]|jgi:RNA polymerase sigma factor (sigma-70 family)|nr:sigma-70 family RNA polymerase sigma factor [Tannerella sp.]
MREQKITYEKKLWILFLEGDEEAYAELYTTYVNILFAYGMHFTTNREVVKDCVQDVFTKLYVNRSRLIPIENVKVYLFTTMRNTLFNLFKKEVEHHRLDLIEPAFHIEFPVEHQIIEQEQLTEQKKKLEEFMKKITSRQKEVLYYRFVEELSFEDICKLMHMNYQSVRNLLHRTISSIRNATKPDITSVG